MTARVRVGRIIYFILASLFALSTMMQFFFAGSAIFMDPVEWRKHVTFVHLFGFNLPLFMMLFAFIGKLPRIVYLQIIGIMVGIFFMYFTVNFTGVPWTAALHPVIGTLLFLLSCFTVVTSWKHTFKTKGENTN